MQHIFPPHGYALGVDIGGTNISAAVVETTTGTVIHKEVIETLASQGIESGMRRIIALIDRVLDCSQQDISTILGIGIGCTGPLDMERGTIQNPYTLPTWDGMPIVDTLTRRFQLPVVLINDAHAATLAEHEFGAGRGAQHMLFITVSTGIGSGLILNKRLYRGQKLTSGEFGHTSIAYDGIPCYCGARGCLEMYAAGPAIAKFAQAQVRPDTPLWELCSGDSTKLTARHVGQAAAEGDAVAIELLAQTGRYLGVGISNLISLLAPDVIVLGGGVMQSQQFILPEIKATIAPINFLIEHSELRIVTAELALNAGVIGAAVGISRYLKDQL